MTWLRIDDKAHGHRKWLRVWEQDRAALGLHVMALAYCSDHLTDGIVDPEFVRSKIPQPVARNRAVGALVEAHLWHPLDENYHRIHDFLEYNPRRADVLERRQGEKDRKVAARDAAKARRNDVVRDLSARTLSDGDDHVRARPLLPTRPDPTRNNPSVGFPSRETRSEIKR